MKTDTIELPAGSACLTRACYAYYKRPVKTPDGYWKYRRGGYDPEDGSYGRCGTRSEAMDILRHNARSAADRENKQPHETDANSTK